MKKLFISFPLFLLLFNCSDHIVSDCSIDTTKSGIVQKTTFTEIQNQIFTPSCATTGCHAGNNPAASLNLTAGVSFQNLVNVNSIQKPELSYVLPGNSASSYLIQKLNGQNTTVMPPSGKLQSALIDSVIKWIDEGAPNN